MEFSNNHDDARSEITATTGTTVHTPSTDEHRFRYRPLSHGNKFLIVESLSGKAIAPDGNGGLCLQDLGEAGKADHSWLCVESGGYLGLLNSKTGRYIGHNGEGVMQASVTKFGAWECITTRDQPGGGYKLLVPHWWYSLKTVVVAEDGKTLVTRDHGNTLWDFIQVAEDGGLMI
ncbi:hypothetical protein B0T18DRAFT_414142 [Schizothecium vesticola]|uniref:Ricin B lectin domain-containing protein n=1 Tax=Schizothecium vesticola TaxID=314040 RepID=A0AA40K284_9PEZI|nr:hypothetical protein B0T18DRAFT_414142 [Schizothecium vesticola]